DLEKEKERKRRGKNRSVILDSVCDILGLFGLEWDDDSQDIRHHPKVLSPKTGSLIRRIQKTFQTRVQLRIDRSKTRSPPRRCRHSQNRSSEMRQSGRLRISCHGL